MSDVQLGESFIGKGAEAAHVNTVLGPREGAVGTAWATALAGPTVGHQPFVAILRPGLPVKPLTLFVNKATIEADAHGLLHWGPAQAGIAAGVADAVADGVVPADQVDELALIAAVWVNPAAADADLVYRNNREAVRTALAAGASGHPDLDDVLAARAHPRNPFYAAD
ncbi:formaldehyde-activating enzyme [Nocardioides mesophilus]|uniref:Formaldehyde-activating enzyme n=1 Tax=Nocardioides mesophilus TaxID=433659 RepID=A0A7G9R8G6_9ACTN|nr:formaldehyde-activating enzyme [Nocardioides mesophilus]QNN51891.1 formaldehyde-activating enzyme [Nocardioides mesophilus]